MYARIIIVSIAAFLYTTVHSAESRDEGRYGAKPLKGDYYVYGGTLGEMTPPTQKDRKVSFMLTGPLAKDLFNQLGPDVRKDNACSSSTDYRERRRGDLDCVFTKSGGYVCYLGLNVRDGKSMIGSIC